MIGNIKKLIERKLEMRKRIIKRNVQENQVRTTKIQQTMRMSVKIRDNFYTVEYQEERAVPNSPNIDLEQEKSRLYESCRDNIYAQVQEIIDGLQ